MIRGNAGTGCICLTAVHAIPKKMPDKHFLSLKFPLNLSLYGKFASKKETPNREKSATDPEVCEMNSMNWHQLAQGHEGKQQGIYCDILQARVKKCKLISCEYYASCHSTV